MKTLCLALVTALSIASTAPAQILSGTGTAVIDGVIFNDEWADAAAPLFLVTVPGGGTVNGTLFVMNDATTLYIALSVVHLGDILDLGVFLDATGDGETLGAGDDAIGFTADGFARDSYYTGLLRSPDTSDGGALDVVGASSTTTNSTYIELSHPLDSGDAGHDIAVGPDDLVAFFARISFITDGATTFYPGPDSGIEAQIQIAPDPEASASAALALICVALLRSRAATR